MASSDQTPLIALLYSDDCSVDAEIAALAAHFGAAKYRVAGFVQHARNRPGYSRCDMILEELTTRTKFEISQDRGPQARGCRLNEDALLEAMQCAKKAIEDHDVDLLILNKFGKAECEGRGFRPLITDALERGIAVLVPVPLKNQEAWREFAGDLAIDIEVGEQVTFSWLHSVVMRSLCQGPAAVQQYGSAS